MRCRRPLTRGTEHLAAGDTAESKTGQKLRLPVRAGESALTEWTIHGWDLARALNADDSLDAELVESLYARLAPRVDALANTGYFQPPTGLPDTAPLQNKLLDLLGRRP